MARGVHDIVGDPLLRPPGTPAEGAPAARQDREPASRPRPAAPGPGSVERPESSVRATSRVVRAGSAAPVDTDFRPDIEGVRAIAVIAVLLYHAHVGPFEGGYIGVDVFFVVSGYLITRLLANEVGRSGTISLSRFWARRARRLLPASTLVVLATVAASRWMLDPLTQGFVNRSAVAASGFAANFLFWTRGGYSQLTLPEPLLHFWSLAVEEQFYLFWPLLLLAVVRMGGHFRRLATTVAVAVAVASFAFCVAITPSRQPMAFYFLPARAWELAAGALLALAGPALFTGRERVRATLAWVGLGGIVLCALRFNDPQYGFPGAKAALPVLATVLVIIGGVRAPGGPGVLLGQPLMQWIGKRSYALYLWHYPILVLVAAKWGPLSSLQRAGLLGVSFVAAALSFALVEDPIRRSNWLAERPGRSVGLGAGLATAGVMTAVVLLSIPQDLSAGTAAEAARIVVAADPAADPTDTNLDGGDPATTEALAPPDTSPTVTSPTDTSLSDGASPADSTAADDDAVPANPDSLVRLAADNANALEKAAANELVPSNLRPSLREAYDDRPDIYGDGCLLGGNETQPGECVYGTPGAATTVVLFGDSHAAQWFPAFESVARRRGWELVVMTKQACPTGDVPLQIAGQSSECRRWRENVLERLRAIEPDLLVMASFRYQGTNATMWRDGLGETMAQFRPVADQVLILGDTPTPKGDVPSCVAAHLRSLTRCNTDRSDAVRDHWLAADAAVATAHDAQLITTGDWLCAAEECPVVLGDVLLYRDESHLTTDAAALLEPYVDASLRAALRG